jgi:hypothetical protein
VAKTQTLSFPIRLPDVMQQVERHLFTRSGHGNRQERCEMEQASRKQVFQTILPLLSEGLIKYEELQSAPILSVGHLTFAGDDRMKAGQTYRARIDISHVCDLSTRQEYTSASLALRLRTPDSLGKWAWGAWSEAISLTHCHQPAKTFASSVPMDRKKAIKWGAWLCCANPDCLWNGARDYAASVNIARLGMAFLVTYQETKRYVAYRLADSSVKPALLYNAGDYIPPDFRQTCLLCWLVLFRIITHLSSEKSAHSVFYVPTETSTCSNVCNVRIVSCFCNGILQIYIYTSAWSSLLSMAGRQRCGQALFGVEEHGFTTTEQLFYR